MVKELPFFWDNILFSSKLPSFIYSNGLSHLIFPEKIDSGHPPFWSWLLAAEWKILGRSLWASHFLMLPFLISNGILILKIGEYYKIKWLWLLLLLFIFEPTYLAQSTQVSLEIALLFGVLTIWYSILYDKKLMLIIASIFIALISIRGAVLVFAMAIFHFFAKQKDFKIVKYYLPSAMVFVLWYVYHYSQTGYVFQSANSGWASSNELITIQQFFKNIAITIWRFIDFGRIIICAIAAFSFVYYLRRKEKLNHFFVLFFALTFALLVASFARNAPILHRYFLPAFVLLIFIAIQFLQEINWKQSIKNALLAVAFLAFVLGHFIIYPKTIAQGWDASLAHLPYFFLEKKMNENIFTKKLNANVCAAFPTFNSEENTELFGYDLKKKNWLIEKQNCRFVEISNINNDFSDKEIETIEGKWLKIDGDTLFGVYLNLYQNPKYK